jgi:hypothetical protein
MKSFVEITEYDRLFNDRIANERASLRRRWGDGFGADGMRGQLGFFDVDARLKPLSDLGDRLEAFRAVVDFELFRADSTTARTRSRRSKEAAFRRIGRTSPPSCARRWPSGSSADEPRCALDCQVQQSQAARRRLDAAGRSGDSAVRLSEPRLDRLRLRLHPPMGPQQTPRAAVCAKASSTRAIRRAGSGPIPPTDRQPTRCF